MLLVKERLQDTALPSLGGWGEREALIEHTRPQWVPRYGPSGPQGADPSCVTVPNSPVVPGAGWWVPLCLPRGDTGKVSVLLVRRGCPPVAAAAPAPAPARPVGAQVAQLPLGGSRWLPAVGQRCNGSSLPERCCPPHQPTPMGHPTPSSLCPHPLHAPLPAAATLESPQQCGDLNATTCLHHCAPPRTTPNPRGLCSRQIHFQLVPHPSCPRQAWHTINMKDFLALCRRSACAPAAGN